MDILTYLVPIMAMVFISFICAIGGHEGFSLNTFLICISVCVPILIWVNIFPNYLIVVSILCIGSVLFGRGEL